jgi:hypothetical protein
MKKITIEVYTFDELSDEAKEKAREWYREGIDYPFLEEFMNEFIYDKLTEAGYMVDDLKVLYSLTYSQGDGVSFTAKLTKGLETYQVNRSGHYVHERTMDVYHETEDGEETEEPEVLEEMRKIAKEAEKAGYKYIEYEESNEAVDETIRANEYPFTKNGERRVIL